MANERLLPQTDRFYMETISFVYAAVIGYGFSVWDFDDIDPANLLQWSELLFYVGTIAIIGMEYAFVREIYAKEGAYKKFDFFLDIAIVFCFSRMLDNAPELYTNDGIPCSFRWWLWLGIIFSLYVIWDACRIMKGTPQKMTIAVDICMIVFSFSYFLLPDIWPSLLQWSHEGYWPMIFALLSIIFYAGCVWIWRYEAMKSVTQAQ